MKKVIILPVFLVLFFCGCSITENGEDLSGFLSRLNGLNKEYLITEKGFLYENEARVFSKFFKFSENELLLKLNTDEKGRLNEMNIVLESELRENKECTDFVLNLTKAFIFDEETEKNIIDNEFKKTLKCTCPETHKKDFGNIKTLIDVTESGTVITVYKDI